MQPDYGNSVISLILTKIRNPYLNPITNDRFKVKNRWYNRGGWIESGETLQIGKIENGVVSGYFSSGHFFECRIEEFAARIHSFEYLGTFADLP